MEAKKKYTPSGVVIAEMICSAILVIAVFLPWVRVESMGEIKEIALTEYGPLAFIYGGVFVFNIILKFFKRSRWLSALTALVAILMHTELGADHLNSPPNYYPVHYAPAIGEQIIFVVGLALMIIVCVSWIVSLLNSIANYYRNKRYLMLYSSCLGLFFLLFVVAMLIGIVMAGSADAFTEGEDTPFKMVVGVFLWLALLFSSYGRSSEFLSGCSAAFAEEEREYQLLTLQRTSVKPHRMIQVEADRTKSLIMGRNCSYWESVLSLYCLSVPVC